MLFASTADVADHINLTTKTDVSGLSTSIAQLGMRVGMLLGSVGVSVILSLGKYDAQAANNGLHNLLSPCLLKDADMQSFLWSVAFC